jgi:hypothetical protein
MPAVCTFARSVDCCLNLSNRPSNPLAAAAPRGEPGGDAGTGAVQKRQSLRHCSSGCRFCTARSVAHHRPGQAERTAGIACIAGVKRGGLLTKSSQGWPKLWANFEGSNRDCQSMCWAKSLNLGQPCTLFVS